MTNMNGQQADSEVLHELLQMVIQMVDYLTEEVQFNNQANQVETARLKKDA
ncbi:MAG: hypothetical protein GY943_27615 [Chloroflexi bacterium]|nr:hypothetical protein [Chloroflexota bacterium]